MTQVQNLWRSGWATNPMYSTEVQVETDHVHCACCFIWLVLYMASALLVILAAS